MDYDFGSTTTFRIEYLSSSSLMESKENYPLVIEGQGKGMLDDMSDFELKDIVDETDRLGKSEFYYTPESINIFLSLKSKSFNLTRVAFLYSPSVKLSKSLLGSPQE